MFKVSLLAAILFSAKYTQAEERAGFYLGAGSGINLTSNYNLSKTFYSTDYVPQVQAIGNVTSSSFPIIAYAGYRFNSYLASEFLYSYSGNQIYAKASNDPNPINTYWGSQNTFSLSAIGYLPLSNNWYLKGRAGLGFSMDTMTTYAGDPGTGNFTSVLGVGTQYFISNFLAIDVDYINYGWLLPLHLNYKAPGSGGPNLGIVDSLIVNLFTISISYQF